VIEGVVAPVDHTLFVEEDEVSTTFPPAQNVVAPLVVIVGVDGSGFTVTTVAAEATELHDPAVTSTV
jgi:hypothetical protein